MPASFRPAAALGLIATLACSCSLDAQSPDSRLDQLEVLTSGYPRVYFFRSSEGMAAQPRMTFERWEACFSRLMGIEGKVLDEEVRGRSTRNIDFFSRFKDAHPHQLVMEHYNGLARDPQDATHFHAGHWLYHNGAIIESEVPAAPGEFDLEVDQARLFRTQTGRLGNANEDIGLCELDESGKPDWSKAEQVKLISVTVKRGGKGTIRVLRGQFGTQPRAFARGRSYAAAHVWNGPWGKSSQLLWDFNFSSACPKDRRGRTCSEAFADELGALFAKGGRLEKFDGIQFDVMRHSFFDKPRAGQRDADCDADGKADAGFIQGRDTYAEGVIGFCRLLRERLGPGRLILADGWNWDHVRAFGILNGMESEGWPKLGDQTFADWCGGINRAAFRNSHSAAPVFNYINHKGGPTIARPGKLTGKAMEGNYAYHRLVFAAAMMTDNAMCSSLPPPTEDGEIFGIWDEWWCGTAKKLGWLGLPKGGPIRLAFESPDLLDGAGSPPSETLLQRIKSDNAGLSILADGLRVTGREAAQESTTFQLTVPAPARGDLVLRFQLRADPSANLPKGAARIVRCGTVRNRWDLPHSWIDEKTMDYTFSASSVSTNVPLEITFDIEGSEPWIITRLTAHAHPDAMVREFDHGVVLANPSDRPFDFDLAGLLPGRKLHRIQGTKLQDPTTNNGQPVGGKILVGPRDGLFLIKAG